MDPMEGTSHGGDIDAEGNDYNSDGSEEYLASSESDYENDDPDKLYSIEKVNVQQRRRYGIEETTFRAKFGILQKDVKLLDLKDSLLQMFDEMISEAGRNYGDEDRARLQISHR